VYPDVLISWAFPLTSGLIGCHDNRYQLG